ncbi:aspartate aminotransferase family protein, partial [Candidatus Bathyarchaeota archaeon]
CGNPVSLTAGLTTLKLLEDGKIINRLNQMGDRVRAELREIFEAADIDVQVTGISSLFHTHFTKSEVKNVRDVMNANRRMLLDYHMHLVENGIFFLPTKTGGLCAAHSEEDLEKLFREAENYTRKVK